MAKTRRPAPQGARPQATGLISRRQAVTLIAGGLAAPAVLREARAASTTIKLGFVSPETGPIAAFGAADSFVLDGLKARLAKGVVVGGKRYPVEVLRRDSQSSADRASDVAGQLINGENVNIMLASSTSDTTNPVSDQCEVNAVPCISTDTPWQAWFFGRKGNPAKPFEWTYHFFWGVGDMAAAYTGLWSSIATNKRVGALWSNDPDGVAVGNQQVGMPALIKKAGFELVDLRMFSPMSQDFSAQIAELKKAKVDVVTGVFLPPDFTTFWTQSAQQGFQPKAATIAKALLFPSSVEAQGDRGAGLSSEVWWSPGSPFKSSLTGQSAAQYTAAYTAQTGHEWTQPMGFKHALIEVAMNVLERCKNLDPDTIRDAIRATDMHSLVGPVSWKHGPLPNICVTPLVGGQWEKGKKFKYDLLIANNKPAPFIPLQKKFQPIVYS